jgi:hypothetical protein
MEKLPDNLSEEDFVKLAELNRKYEEAREQIRCYKRDTQPWNGGGDGPTMVEGLKPLLEDMKQKLNELTEFCREKSAGPQTAPVKKAKESCTDGLGSRRVIEDYIVIQGELKYIGGRGGILKPGFQEDINDKIKEGYIPQGGITIGGRDGINLFQAMVSYKK